MSNATKAEREWMALVVELGCCVCVREGLGPTPCEIHHLLTPGRRRIGHTSSIGLCPAHHRSGRNDAEVVSRHPWKREFESRYASEPELLEETRRRIGARAMRKPFIVKEPLPKVMPWPKALVR